MHMSHSRSKRPVLKSAELEASGAVTIRDSNNAASIVLLAARPLTTKKVASCKLSSNKIGITQGNISKQCSARL